MLGIYALLVRAELPINAIIVIFGLFVAAAMGLVIRLYRYNKARYNLDALIGVEKHPNRP